jgi:hypothetical protein
VNWYKNEHRHSGLRYVAPDRRHRAKHGAIPATPYVRRPERCSSNTRHWRPIGAVTLNPDNEEVAPSGNEDKNPLQAL